MDTVERDEASELTIAACVRGRRELSPPLNSVARRLRISAQIIFFQRKVGVGLGKGARACGKSYHFDTREKKRYIDFGAWVGYYVV